MATTRIRKSTGKKETHLKRDKKDEIYHIDLRQDDAWDYYTDKKSETYNNAYKSALKAGYTDSSARRITIENWWNKKVMLLKALLPRAEEVLLEDLNMETKKTIFKNEEVIQVINPQLRRIRSDTAMFVGETLGRKMYHKKVEVDNNQSISLIEGNEQIDKLFRKK